MPLELVQLYCNAVGVWHCSHATLMGVVAKIRVNCCSMDEICVSLEMFQLLLR